MNFIAIVPARKGSKGLHKKNIRKIGGIELWRHSVETALKCKEINKIIVTTDMDEILQQASKYQDVMMIKRNRELSDDVSSIVDVAIDAVTKIEDAKRCIVVLLQPTSPFRNPNEVDNAIRKYKSLNGRGLISVRESNEHPYECILDGRLYKLNKTTGRQQYPKSLFITGSIYIEEINNLIETKSFCNENTYYFETHEPIAVDIDYKDDYDIACALYEFMRKRGYAAPFEERIEN